MQRLGYADHLPRHTGQTRIFFEHVLESADILIAAERLARATGWGLANLKHELTLKRELAGKVVPDGYFELRVPLEEGTAVYPVVIELDRDTEDHAKWRGKVRHLLSFVEGSAATIGVVVTRGGWRRALQLRGWTEAELIARGWQADGDLFRFTAASPGEHGEVAFFTGHVWAVPFAESYAPLVEVGTPGT